MRFTIGLNLNIAHFNGMESTSLRNGKQPGLAQALRSWGIQGGTSKLWNGIQGGP